MKRLLILAVAVVGLAAYVVFVELPARRAEQDKLTSDAKALEFDPEGVREIRVQRGQQLIQLTFDGDEWRMLAPKQEPADAFRIRNFLITLAEIERFRRMDDDGEDALRYGLGRMSETAVRLELDGTTQISIEVGDLTPTGGACYFRHIGENAIDVADASLHEMLNRPTSYFRNSNLGAFSDSTLVRIGVRGEWSAVRSPERLWWSEGGERRELKQWLLDEFVFDLAHTQIVGYAREDLPEQEFAAYGLEPPAFEIEWEDASGSSGVLAIGNDSEEQSVVFARRNGEPDVLLVSDQVVERAQMPRTEWIDHNPLDEDFKSMREVEAELEDGKTALARGPKAFDLRAVLPAGVDKDPEDLHIAIRNVYYGLARFETAGEMGFADVEAADRAVERWAVRATLRWSDHERRIRIGWNGQGDTHWLQIDYEPKLYRIQRELFFRLQGWVLGANSEP